MQNKGIKETTLPRLINDGTPTLAGIVALVGVIVIALIGVKLASTSTILTLPDEAELTLSWNDGQETKTEKIIIELYPDEAPVHVEIFTGTPRKATMTAHHFTALLTIL